MSKANLYLSLVGRYPIITDQMTAKRLLVILREMERVIVDRDIEGEIVEFGCYSGTTSLFMERLLQAHNSNNKLLYVYDSFEGLPDKSIKDASVAGTAFKAGELKATKRQLIKNFKQAGLRLPVIHKGWFSDLKESDMPSTIAFCLLDGDFYDSIMDSLKLVWPRLAPNGSIVVDDYDKSNLPGVTRALNDFFKNQNVRIRHEHDLAIIRNNLR